MPAIFNRNQPSKVKVFLKWFISKDFRDFAIVVASIMISWKSCSISQHVADTDTTIKGFDTLLKGIRIQDSALAQSNITATASFKTLQEEVNLLVQANKNLALQVRLQSSLDKSTKDQLARLDKQAAKNIRENWYELYQSTEETDEAIFNYRPSGELDASKRKKMYLDLKGKIAGQCVILSKLSQEDFIDKWQQIQFKITNNSIYDQEIFEYAQRPKIDRSPMQDNSYEYRVEARKLNLLIKDTCLKRLGINLESPYPD